MMYTVFKLYKSEFIHMKCFLPQNKAVLFFLF